VHFLQTKQVDQNEVHKTKRETARLHVAYRQTDIGTKQQNNMLRSPRSK